MNKRLLKLILAMLAVSVLTALWLSVSVSAEPAEFNAVEDPMPEQNWLGDTSFDNPTYSKTTIPSGKLTQIMTPTGGYLQYSRLVVNTPGVAVYPDSTVPAGTYRFTGYFRMMYKDEITWLRLSFIDKNGAHASPTIHIYPTSDEWLKVEVYITLTAPLKYITVGGGPWTECLQPYCVDNFSLVGVGSIPDGYVVKELWGNKATPAEIERSQVDSLIYYPKYNTEFESQYEVQGIMVNQDADSVMGSANTSKREDFEKFALGYEGSHVTDFMICVNNKISTFPTDLDSWTDMVDKYYQKVENGKPVDYSQGTVATQAYKHFVQYGLDYIDIWCETFPKIGINPWLSFRMNDAHGYGAETSILLSDYYHENPQLRRVQHTNSATDIYYRPLLDWQYEEVRQRFLEYINYALSMYDCYGIELDWQREIRCFGVGQEYNALKILNEFMRDVQDIVNIYERKYGHDIKVGVRVTSDIETNYDFGLDILTWASEGLIDLVSPTGRHTTTDNTIPVSMWVSLMHPYGVQVAPCIEIQLHSNPDSAKTVSNENAAKQTLETYNGAAALYLSQGADKVAVYNQYLALAQYIQQKHKVVTTNDEVAGTFRHWTVLSTIGSYDKLMTRNRRLVLTYNDVWQYWKETKAQLPITVKKDEIATIRVPVGDVPVGATVYVKFSVNGLNASKRPTVYVNSKPATWNSMEMVEPSLSLMQVLSYTVPESVYDDGYFTIEIIPQRALAIDYAEVYIHVTDEVIE